MKRGIRGVNACQMVGAREQWALLLMAQTTGLNASRTGLSHNNVPSDTPRATTPNAALSGGNHLATALSLKLVRTEPLKSFIAARSWMCSIKATTMLTRPRPEFCRRSGIYPGFFQRRSPMFVRPPSLTNTATAGRLSCRHISGSRLRQAEVDLGGGIKLG